MSDEPKNPFEGMDQNTSPSDLLRALVDRATITNEVGPMGAAIGLVQKEMESVFDYLRGSLGGMVQTMNQTTLMIDLVRLTNALIIHILIDKGVISKEEFDGLYETRVESVMAEHVEQLRAEHGPTEAEQAEAQEAIEAAEEIEAQEVTSPADIPKPEPLKESQPIEDSEPILASERMAAKEGSNVIEFKSKDEKKG